MNKNMNFVQRIQNPDKSPFLDLGNGKTASHKMAWGEGDGKYFVYPTIIQQGKELKQLDNKSAWQHAMKNKEFMEFNNPEEADWVSRNYKMLWKK